MRKAKAAPPEPWSLRVGVPCTFYHEGGHGEKYWSNGWRYGIVREIPTKGAKKNWARVEIPVKLYGWDDGQLKNGVKKKRGWFLREPMKAWVFTAQINEPGDFIYHGPKLDEIVAARKVKKAVDVKKAAKPAPKRFKS